MISPLPSSLPRGNTFTFYCSKYICHQLWVYGSSIIYCNFVQFKFWCSRWAHCSATFRSGLEQFRGIQLFFRSIDCTWQSNPIFSVELYQEEAGRMQGKAKRCEDWENNLLNNIQLLSAKIRFFCAERKRLKIELEETCLQFSSSNKICFP